MAPHPGLEPGLSESMYCGCPQRNRTFINRVKVGDNNRYMRGQHLILETTIFSVWQISLSLFALTPYFLLNFLRENLSTSFFKYRE